MCEVVNLLHTVRPVYDVYIGYATSWEGAGKWSNQFDVAGDLYLEARSISFFQGLAPGDILDVDYAVLMYRNWLLHSKEGLSLQEDIDELRGKILGCFCKPAPCHGDVLVELLGQRENG